jgi:hypothetical protein
MRFFFSGSTAYVNRMAVLQLFHSLATPPFQEPPPSGWSEVYGVGVFRQLSLIPTSCQFFVSFVGFARDNNLNFLILK